MNLEELEDKINQDILNDNIDYNFGCWGIKDREHLSYSDTQTIVEKLIRKYLKNTIYYNDIYISSYGGQHEKGNIIITSTYTSYNRKNDYKIVVKIKRKVNHNMSNYLYGVCYYIDKINIITIKDDRNNKNIKTIEDFMSYCRYKNNQYNNEIKQQALDFIDKLAEYNLNFKDFEKLESEYRTLSYDSQVQLRKGVN